MALAEHGEAGSDRRTGDGREVSCYATDFLERLRG
jgi:hypothetical protein